MNLKPGDIILCSGKGRLSRYIQITQRVAGAPKEAAMISHVAMIASYCEVESCSCSLVVFESTTLNKWADKRGVQMNPLHEWIEQYHGKIYLRRFIGKIKPWALYGKAFSLIGTPYENGIPGLWELLLCAFRINQFVKKAELHCTQAVVEVLKMLEYMLPKCHSSNCPPWIWWGREIEKYLINCALEKPERIK